ncbi:Uncharacterised protein [Mycobacteroides abscessus subsp. abscessus]|nr:Uncharacterised protein [Mycobacteroides abscessus subsp. abscessus]
MIERHHFHNRIFTARGQLNDKSRISGQQAVQFSGVRALVDPAAVVLVSGAGNEHLGLELTEPGRRPLWGVVLPTSRPHGAHRRGGQEGHHRIGHIRQVGGHTVATPHPETAQLPSHGADPAGQFPPADLGALPRLVHADDGDAIAVHMAQHLGHVVELDTGKPLRPRHHHIGQHARITVAQSPARYLEKLPERPPKLRHGLDRPAPHVLVVVAQHCIPL